MLFNEGVKYTAKFSIMCELIETLKIYSDLWIAATLFQELIYYMISVIGKRVHYIVTT
jgi:hypothetical protein